MIALIDGDLVCYRCAASCENEDESIALSRVSSLVDRLVYETNASEYECYLGGKGNWRKEIYPDYKANRKDYQRPRHLDICQTYLREQHKVISEDMFEADDLMSIRQYACLDQGVESIIVSLDKDLLQVPGWHYSWEIRGKGPTGKEWIREASKTFVSPLQGLRRFYGQVISGDGADNIPSFDGKVRSSVPKFIQAMIDELDNMDTEEEMYMHCKGLYGDPHYENISEMHRNAQCLYMIKNREDRWKAPKLNG